MKTSSDWQRLVLSRLSQTRLSEAEQGISLIECIMAIAVIALATAMITPPLFIAAATRMQNQRAEQAMQIAQGEVDRIRFLVERQRHFRDRLPAEGVRAGTAIGTVPAPTSLSPSIQSESADCPRYNEQQLPAGQALAVDASTPNDCEPDFAVQRFIIAGDPPPGEEVANPSNARPGTFCLVVRVYSKPAIEQLEDGGTLQTEPASVRFTDGQGNQRTQPLAVMTTPMIWSDRDFSSTVIRESGGTPEEGSNICG